MLDVSKRTHRRWRLFGELRFTTLRRRPVVAKQTFNVSAQRRAENMPAKHDDAVPRVRCSRRL